VRISLWLFSRVCSICVCRRQLAVEEGARCISRSALMLLTVEAKQSRNQPPGAQLSNTKASANSHRIVSLFPSTQSASTVDTCRIVFAVLHWFKEESRSSELLMLQTRGHDQHQQWLKDIFKGGAISPSR
jgi:hypothetical protein